VEAPVSVRQTGGSLRPLDPDEMMCIWCSPQSGTYEWLVGRQLADELLNGGMETINGNPVRLEVVDTPKLGGVHIRATMTEPVRC